MCILLATLWASAIGAANDPIASIRALVEAGKTDVALERLETIIGDEPENIEALLLRGVILTRIGQTERATGEFVALAKSHPKLAEPHNNLAVLYANQGRYDEARGALLKAIELQPRYDTAHENLGDIYVKLAADAYGRAFELNADNQRALSKSKELAGQLGRKPANEPQTAGPLSAKSKGGEKADAQTAQPETPVPPQPTLLAKTMQQAKAPGPDKPEASRQKAADKAEAGAKKPKASAKSDKKESASSEKRQTATKKPAAPDEKKAKASSPTVASRPLGAGCFAVGKFHDEDELVAVAAWFDALGASVRTVQTGKDEPVNYKVFIPPLESRAAALSKIEEMKGNGIKDIAIYSRGDLVNGIGLGVFGSVESAERRVSQLQKAGYEPAYQARFGSEAFFRLHVNMGPRTAFDSKMLARAFPERRFEIADCG